jgi:hypothetical protein
MELFAEILSVMGALLLSVSAGVLVEELVFGGLVRLFFAHRREIETALEQKKREQKGEGSCLR